MYHAHDGHGIAHSIFLSVRNYTSFECLIIKCAALEIMDALWACTVNCTRAMYSAQARIPTVVVVTSECYA